MLFRILALLILFSSPALADYEAGRDAFGRKDWARAIAALRPAAESGDDRALFLLGRMYLDGNGVVASPPEAMSLYRRAAEKKNTEAMISIAAMHQGGIGVRKDPALSSRWFGHAAALGNQAAAFLYAISLFQGDASGKTDFKPDPAAAYKWLKIAANGTAYKNVADAAKAALPSVANRLTSVEITRLDKEAAAWKPADPGPLP